MVLLTSFEAIYMVELSMKQTNPGGYNSAQGFLNDVLDIKKNKPLLSRQIDMIKKLRQVKQLYDAFQRTNLLDSQIIDNMKSRFRKKVVIEEVFKKLKDIIDDAENINESTRNELLGLDDFATCLLAILKLTCDPIALYGKTEWGNSGSTEIYDDTTKAMYEDYKKKYDIEFETYLQVIGGELDTPELKEINKFLPYLTKVSESIYKDILDKENRYHATNIFSQLLTLGSEKELPVYGNLYGKDFIMEKYFQMKENIFIIGEGGIGKTTLLINKLNELSKDSDSLYIPIYLPLNKLKYNNFSISGSFIFSAILEKIIELMDNHAIRAELTQLECERKLKKVLNANLSQKKILLMLDGFNEISNSTESNKRNVIQSEIQKLASCNNVKIILTSRSFNGAEKSFEGFLPIYAKGISNSTLDNFLVERNISIPNDYQLYNLLHNPLFLLMHISNSEKGIEANTRGGILYEFINGNSSNYNEIARNNDLDGLAKYTPLLLDFVIPAIAAKMEMQDTFYLPHSELDNIINDLSSLTKPFDYVNDKFFDKNGRTSTLTSYANSLLRFGEKVEEYLTEGLAFVQIDGDKNLYFIHQYIKDYFASIFRLLAYRQGFENKNNLFNDYAHTLMDSDTMQLTNEVALQSNICNVDHLKNILDDCPDKENNYFIHNMLMMLSTLNNNSLSGFEFKDLDLSSVSFSKFRFSDGMNSSIFTNCKVSENSFVSSMNATILLRTFTIYDNKPAVCEFYIYSSVAFLIIKELKSDNTLFTDTIDFFSGETYMDFTDFNTIKLSSDNKYMLIYSDTFSAEFFYVYNLVEHKLTIHQYDFMGDNPVYSFVDNDRLVLACDNSKIAIYDLNYKNTIPESLLLDASYIFDASYKGIIDSFTLPIDEELLSIEKKDRYRHFSMYNIYSFKNLLVFMFNGSQLSECVYVYNVDEKMNVPILLPKSPVSLSYYVISLNKIPSLQIKERIFFTFATTIFELDLIKLCIKNRYSNSDLAYLALGHKNNVLYATTRNQIINIDLNDFSVLDENELYIRSDVDTYATNDNLLVLGEIIDSTAISYVCRFDTHEVLRYKYNNRITIKHIEYLSNNRIVIVYSSGYVALVNSSTFTLINNFMLDDSKEFITMAYSEAKEQLALVTTMPIDHSNKNAPTCNIQILNTTCNSNNSFSLITELYGQEQLAQVCYSTDGRFLIHEDMGTIYIYATDTFDVVKKLEIDHQVYCIKAYENYVVIIHDSYNHSTTYNATIIDFYDDHIYYEAYPISSYTDYPQLTNDEFEIICSLPRYEGLSFDEFCATEIADNIYEVIYTDKPVNKERNQNTHKRFFYYDNNTTYSSDFYQDGYLIKCSSGHYPKTGAIYKELNMTTKFAHVSADELSYFALNKNNEFIKIFLPNGRGTRLDITPNLLIKNCTFTFNETPNNFVKGIITKNMGIILDSGTN